jgi:hypothetical protein
MSLRCLLLVGETCDEAMMLVATLNFCIIQKVKKNEEKKQQQKRGKKRKREETVNPNCGTAQIVALGRGPSAKLHLFAAGGK